MLTLAIDTAANFCSACVWDEASDRVLAAEERDIGRGHAEQLMDVIAAVMEASGREFSDIGRVAVAVGPGSFTGIRVGVAAARGFGLALNVPVIGVTTLEALARDAQDAGGPEAVTVAVTGGRSQIFMQSFDTSDATIARPRAVADEDAANEVPPSTTLLAGNAAAAIELRTTDAGRAVRSVLDRATGSIGTIARLSAHSDRKPVPLYLRGADAKPQSGFALPRIEPDTKAESA